MCPARNDKVDLNTDWKYCNYEMNCQGDDVWLFGIYFILVLLVDNSDELFGIEVMFQIVDIVDDIAFKIGCGEFVR
jgi:hypothetical protein